MKRQMRARSNKLEAKYFVLLFVSLGISSGCQLITAVDRTLIETGGGGGSSSVGGMGGMGGVGVCSTKDDCPGTDTICRTRTCTSGACGFSDAPAGTPTDNQTADDCKRVVCDGVGTVTTEPDATDPLDDMKDCTSDLCNAGSPENVPVAIGSVCASNGGKVCNALGNCVECIVSADCADGLCMSNQCVPATCADSIMNGSETDVDCGGVDCTPCADGLVCNIATDCQSGVCTSKVCTPPSCMDMIDNGDETDIDCGGNTCGPCGPGLGCTQDSDCVGDSCSGTLCLPTCSDSVENSNETDVDCGGPLCSPCMAGQTCSVDSDCTTGVCTSGQCQAANCMDTVKNGLETDIDCGGGSCLDCGEGKACIQNGDCMSNLCVGGICAGSVCGDGQLSGAEVCDDGNTNSGDCCSAACALESGCEIEPNDTDATANAWTAVAIGNTVKAFNNPTLDKDVFSIVVPPNNKGTLTAEVKDGPLGSKCVNPTDIDSYLTVRNAAGATLATNDDLVQLMNYCSKVTVNNLNPGTYFIEAKRTTLAPAGLATYDYSLQVDLTLVACGDGTLGAGEVCDDANTVSNDGCSSTCTLEQGWACSGQPSACMFTCGNGVITGNEQCDDGNTTSGDGCSNVCLLETTVEAEPNNACGQAGGPFSLPMLLDGAITPVGDQDYIAINVPNYADLKIETFAPTYGSCAMPNDTIIELRGPSCSTVLVTDDEDGINGCSLIDSTVTADAAARHLAPGTYFVRVEEYLNNGTIGAYKLQVTFNALCGNNIPEGSEQCDGGANCAADCMLLPFCGDGLVANGEQCDDGDTLDGDGCSSACIVEADYRCVGTPSVCTIYETNCNDGMDNDSDGSMDAADMDCALPAYFPGCLAGQTLRVYKSFDTPILIPDNNLTGITSFISVVNNVGTIASGALLLNVAHTWIEDIDATLVSPANATFDVTSDNGGSSDNYTSTVFQASCPPITNGMAPFTNCYAPEAPFAALSGTAAQGTWQLKISDDAMDDAGTLNNWALVLCIAP